MSGTAARNDLLTWPWLDRNRRFSWLKASTFALTFAPAIWLVHQVAAGEFGPVPLGGMTYWSGVWATALLLLALDDSDRRGSCGPGTRRVWRR
jgi:DMSO/TMAO reductase YedYZ heme-binding membrane subunit